MFRLLMFLITCTVLCAQQMDLFDASKLELVNVRADVTTHLSKKALRLTQSDQRTHPDVDVSMAVLKGVSFRNGEIQIDLTGEPGAKASTEARGFVGIAFRVQSPAKFENIYLRPTNGRAEDQVRRNHSIQYEAMPDFPWFRMRKEFPEKYESYADLQPSVWTHYRLTVQDTKARLYVNGAAQPSLIVNDLKLGTEQGGVALWIGPGTVGHFAAGWIQR